MHIVRYYIRYLVDQSVLQSHTTWRDLRTLTSNNSLDTNNYKYKNYQLSTIYDEENDKTEDPIEPSKKLPSIAAQIKTALFSSMDAVPIVATEDPFFSF